MANNIIERIWNQNAVGTIEDLSGSVFQAEAGAHTFVISGVDNAGAEVALSGTVAGVFMKPDNTDVPLTGSISNGKASVTLTAECYTVPGRFGLTIFVTSGSVKTAVFAAVGTVSRTNTGNVSASAEADVVDLINRINAAVATVPASWSGLMADIAPTYSPSAVYPAGAYVYYNEDLYRSTTAITTAESWTPAHWTAAVLGDDVSDLKNAITQLSDEVVGIQTFDEINIFGSFAWEIGSLNTSGVETASTARIRTKGYAPVKSINSVSVQITEGYRCAIVWYNANKGFLRDDYWITSDTSLTPPVNSAYVRAVISENPEGTASLDYAEEISVMGSYALLEKVNGLESLVNDEIDDIKSTLSASVGTREITFTAKKYINTNAADIGGTVDLTPIANDQLSYAIIDVTPGESLILNARGYTSGRLWAFLTDDNKLISRSAQSLVAENLTVLVPQNASKCVINSFTNNIGACVVGINPSYEIPKLYETIDADFDAKLGALNDDIFELGYINMSSNGWTYQGSTTTVRLKKNVYIHVNVGDVIGLTSYSGYRWYLGTLDDATGEYGKSGWRSSDWVATINCRVVVTIRKEPSAEVEDYRTLARLFKGFPAIHYVQDNFVNRNDALLLDHDYLVKSINHRGYRNEAPENTLPAFKLSRLHGFKHVETDIGFTSDNIPVLLHDDTINRTAKNADGTAIANSIPISSITYEEALQYVFCGNWYGAYPTVRIPTLAEFMTLCRNIGLHPYLELKHDVGTASQIQQCVEIVKDAGMLDNTTWISFDFTMLEVVKNYSPTSRLAWLVQTPPITASGVEHLLTLKTSENEVLFIGGNYTAEEIEMCKSAGIPIEAGTTSGAGILTLPAYIHGVLTEGALAGQILFEKNITI